MHDAVEALVHDGDTVAIEGFTHLICFAAGHEIIRQRRRDLTLCRLTPDVVYDQMIGAGVASKLVFSWLGNPGVGSLHAIRRRIEHADPAPLEIEEYSHFGMVCRYVAGASNLPFFPIRSYYESDIPKVNPNIRSMAALTRSSRAGGRVPFAALSGDCGGSTPRQSIGSSTFPAASTVKRNSAARAVHTDDGSTHNA
jgi:acyl CoA:acetate/3-ketoacid CoA transferase alpha subunit